MPKKSDSEATYSNVSLTAENVLDSIESVYCRRPGRALLLREFPLDPGTRGKSSYRVDGLLVRLQSAHRTAFEVKVDRKDFQRELKDPEKRQRAMRIVDEFYFVVPSGLVQENEVPPECGLLWVPSDHTALVVKKVAPVSRAPVPTSPLIGDLLRRAYMQGRQDAAKDGSLASWPEVLGIAELLADITIYAAEFDEEIGIVDGALSALQKELYRRGRKSEARAIGRAKKRVHVYAAEFSQNQSAEPSSEAIHP